MKSKVLETKFKKEFTGKFGILYSHGVKLDINGTVQWAEYISKSKEQTTFKVGEEVEFTTIEKNYNDKTYYQIKPVAQNKFNSNFSRKLKQEQSKYSGFAMSYAKDLVVAGKLEFDQMLPAALKMMDWMVEQDKKLENG